MPLSETTQTQDSRFCPLLVTKGYHGSPEHRAQRSKVSFNFSIDGGAVRHRVGQKICPAIMLGAHLA